MCAPIPLFHSDGYLSDPARNRTHNLFRAKCTPIPLGHSDGLLRIAQYLCPPNLFEIIGAGSVWGREVCGVGIYYPNKSFKRVCHFTKTGITDCTLYQSTHSMTHDVMHRSQNYPVQCHYGGVLQTTAYIGKLIACHCRLYIGDVGKRIIF